MLSYSLSKTLKEYLEDYNSQHSAAPLNLVMFSSACEHILSLLPPSPLVPILSLPILSYRAICRAARYFALFNLTKTHKSLKPNKQKMEMEFQEIKKQKNARFQRLHTK